jgi:hypothetical protein
MKRKSNPEPTEPTEGPKRHKADKGKEEKLAPKSDEHFTNYIKWMLATFAEQKDCWYQLVSDDEKTREIEFLDPAQFKKENLVEPQEVPWVYYELLGSTLFKLRGGWLKKKHQEPMWVGYGFVINKCTGVLLGEGLQGSAINTPERFWTAKAAEQIKQGQKPPRLPLGNRICVSDSNGTLFSL